MAEFKPPYIGAAFYPEVWDKSEIEKDIKRMKDTGINMVRLAEFAWNYLEPKEGQFEFKWLHEVVALLQINEIAVTLCTPTAAPPEWLSAKYPEILAVREKPGVDAAGARKHYCPSSPVYRKYSKTITGLLVKEFSKYKAVVSWQIDNEFGSENSTCRCSRCRKAFHDFLGKKYVTPEQLNERWGTGAGSREYLSFSGIPLPAKDTLREQPPLYYNYREFMSKSYADYIRAQEKLIRKGSKAPVTINAIPAFHGLDYQELYRTLDFVSGDLYFPANEIWKYIYEYDWMRAFKNRPFRLLETASTWNGRTAVGENLLNRNSLRAKMWLTYALGGEAVSFWNWRAHWGGQGTAWGVMTYSWGEPTLAEKSVRQVKEELKNNRELITKTTVKKPGAALHLSCQAMWSFETGGSFALKYYKELARFYKVFLDKNIPRDIIFTGAEVTDYKIVFSPFLPVIDGDLLKKMKEFVLKGGVWVAGPLSGFRTLDNTAFKDSALGPLEDLFKIHIRHGIPLEGEGAEPVRLDWPGLGKVKCENFAAAIELKGNGKVLAKYADGPLAAMNAVVEVPFGKGRVIFLGTLPEQKQLKNWLNILAGESKCRTAKTKEEGILITERVDGSGKTAAIAIIEYAGKGGRVELTKSMRNAFSGKKLKKNLKLAPFEAIILI